MEYQTTVTTNQPIVITIGNFDGIHRGHQRLLDKLRVAAQELNATPVLVTFSPHTLLVVRPDIDVQCLTTLEEKLSLAATYGHVADNIVIHFTQDIAHLSAYDFMEALRTHFNLRGLVVGENFKLGHNRAGNVSFLQTYGQEHDIRVQAIRLEEAGQTLISSTRIRALVGEGYIAEANELLGHPVVVSGRVVKGDQRGRLLGFPTANLLPEPHKLLPANGVYVVRAHVEEAAEGDSAFRTSVYNGIVNIGVRPTFNGQRRLLEAHLLDIELDLYDKRITIDFIARLRNEQRFSSIDALKAQITSDAQQARQILQKGA
jgi:riboflavin kinase / FMN adenylyltransferase